MDLWEKVDDLSSDLIDVESEKPHCRVVDKLFFVNSFDKTVDFVS